MPETFKHDVKRLSEGYIPPEVLASEPFRNVGVIAKFLESDQDLKKLWLNKVHIVWILGSLYQESKLNPEAISDSGAYWIAQWCGGRKIRLQNFAKENNIPVSGLETQVKFLIKEMTDPKLSQRGEEDKKAFFALENVEDNIKEATNLFAVSFERPSKLVLDKRVNFAKACYYLLSKRSNLDDIQREPTPSKQSKPITYRRHITKSNSTQHKQ